MTLKIERSTRQGLIIFGLSGRIEAEHLEELRAILERETDLQGVIVDLREIKLVDREVVEYLARCEADGVKLENCPAYIREWMEREKG